MEQNKGIERVTILFSLFIILCFGYTQEKTVLDKVYSYLYVDKAPKFPQGPDNLKLFLKKNIKWPEKDVDIRGTVLLSFVVLKNGSISNIVIEKSLSPKFDNEAKRIILLMPKWSPGELNGQKVNVRIYFPVEFVVSD